MRVAIYARVSTQQQSCDLQLETLRQFCTSRGFSIFREYVDTGISGAKADRPQLNELMSDAKQRKFDAVLIYKLDRFARSLRHLVIALAEFDALGVAFISMTDNLDLTTPSGRLMFQIIGAMAEFERELIRERVRAGITRAIAAGKRWGRKPQEVDLSQVPAGTSIRAAAELTGIGRETIRRAMKRNNLQPIPGFDIDGDELVRSRNDVPKETL